MPTILDANQWGVIFCEHSTCRSPAAMSANAEEVQPEFTHVIPCLQPFPPPLLVRHCMSSNHLLDAGYMPQILLQYVPQRRLHLRQVGSAVGIQMNT